MSTQARERFTALSNGLTRTRALVEQLLTLAHAQEGNGVEKNLSSKRTGDMSNMPALQGQSPAADR